MSDKPNFNHAEAFCLMLYRCTRCGFAETFWNSRDGVTPFIVLGRCQYCFGDMQHINFQGDRCVPDHIPHRGQGIFIDMPESLRRPLALLRVRSGEKSGLPSVEGAVEGFIANIQPGAPWLIRW